MNVTIVGSGHFGLALSFVLSKSNTVHLLCRRLEIASAINENKQHPAIYPDITFSDNLRATAVWTPIIKKADLIFLAVPSRQMITVMDKILHCTPKSNCFFVNLSKGLTQDTPGLLSHFFTKKNMDKFYGVLAGPNLSREIIDGIPTKTVLATSNHNLIKTTQRLFKNTNFHIIGSTDVIGVQWCSILKNIIAFIVGVHDALGGSNNSRAALLVTSIRQMSDFVLSQGGSTETITSLAGLGDVILSCLSRESRNYQLGYKLIKQKKPLEQVTQEIGSSVEVASSIFLLQKMLNENNINQPFFTDLLGVLKSPSKASKYINKVLKIS